MVSRDDIRALYAAHRDQAIRLADRMGANGDSEDCVHNVVLWLIERQDYLKEPPTPAYFFTAVRRAVLERFRTSYIQRIVGMDPVVLGQVGPLEYDELPSGLMDPGDRELAEQEFERWLAEQLADDPAQPVVAVPQ